MCTVRAAKIVLPMKAKRNHVASYLACAAHIDEEAADVVDIAGE